MGMNYFTEQRTRAEVPPSLVPYNCVRGVMNDRRVHSTQHYTVRKKINNIKVGVVSRKTRRGESKCLLLGGRGLLRLGGGGLLGGSGFLGRRGGLLDDLLGAHFLGGGGGLLRLGGGDLLGLGGGRGGVGGGRLLGLGGGLLGTGGGWICSKVFKK